MYRYAGTRPYTVSVYPYLPGMETFPGISSYVQESASPGGQDSGVPEGIGHTVATHAHIRARNLRSRTRTLSGLPV